MSAATFAPKSAVEVAERVTAFYAPHYPGCVTHVRNGLTVRSGPGHSRILCIMPNLVPDRTENLDAMLKAAIDFLPVRLERDSENAKKAAHYAHERRVRDAAPDLLAALEGLLHKANEYRDSKEIVMLYRKDFDAARTALAKAVQS